MPIRSNRCKSCSECVVHTLGCSYNVQNEMSLKCIAWNIQGLDETVLEDEYFNSCLDNNDIVILLETC